MSTFPDALVSVAREVRMSGRILVVDDEPSVLRMVGKILGGQGYEAILVATAADAVAWLDACGGAVRAMLVDYSLGEVSCGALLTHARGAFPSLPVVVMSGYGEGFRDIPELGADAFLAKPFGMAGLVEAVARVIARASKVDATREARRAGGARSPTMPAPPFDRSSHGRDFPPAFRPDSW